MFEDRRIPDLILEQFMLGELSNEKYDEIKHRLNQSSELRSRLAAIENSNQEYQLPLDDLRIASALENRAVRQNESRSVTSNNKFMNLGLAFAACFVVLLAVPLWPTSTDIQNSFERSFTEGASGIDAVRLKGIRPELQIYEKRGADVTRLKDKDEVMQNDSLQLSYIAAGYEYGVIFSIDGRGEVTLHYPANVSDVSKINSKKITSLDYAYKLDDAPSFERFFMVTSAKPLNVEAVLESGEKLAKKIASAKIEKLALSDDVYQTSILLNKVEK